MSFGTPMHFNMAKGSVHFKNQKNGANATLKHFKTKERQTVAKMQATTALVFI
jgi:hypothetical protein